MQTTEKNHQNSENKYENHSPHARAEKIIETQLISTRRVEAQMKVRFGALPPHMRFCFRFVQSDEKKTHRNSATYLTFIFNL